MKPVEDFKPNLPISHFVTTYTVILPNGEERKVSINKDENFVLAMALRLNLQPDSIDVFINEKIIKPGNSVIDVGLLNYQDKMIVTIVDKIIPSNQRNDERNNAIFFGGINIIIILPTGEEISDFIMSDKILKNSIANKLKKDSSKINVFFNGDVVSDTATAEDVLRADYTRLMISYN